MTQTTRAMGIESAVAPRRASGASFWLPEQLVESAWLTHGAFAAWIIDILRPRDVIELGTHNGFSCFAFAEAAKRLGHDITLHALDSWQGDDQAGFYGDEVYASVQEIAERDYPGAVVLHRGYFSATRTSFSAASADLLHIDGRHGYEDAREDYEQWRDTVRDGGVILFHDIAERQEGFGVWQLWDEIAEPGRSFAFDHGHGLGVLAIGDVHTHPLRELFEADAEEADRIRGEFERLGTAIAELARVRALDNEVAALHEVVAMLQGERERLSHEIDVRDTTISELQSSTSWTVTAPLRVVGRGLRRRR